MEKRKVISCILTAIEDDEIEGDFTEDLKTFVFPTISSSNQAGDISKWTINVQAYDTNKDKAITFKKNMIKCPVEQLPKYIVGRYWVVNETHTGHIRDTDITNITEGKNIGKKNATTSVGQAILIANKLYKDKVNRSKSFINTNPLPMLVKPEGKTGKAFIKDDEFERNNIVIQPKFDGIRCMAHLDSNNEVELYSRTAKNFYGLTNITRDVSDLLFKQNIYPPKDIYLDGEIYEHGKQLQDISGAVRGEATKSGNVVRSDLKYYVFDCLIITHPNMPQSERLNILKRMFANKQYDNMVFVESQPVSSRAEMEEKYAHLLDEGYEGAIARRLDRIYEPSKNSYHSDALLKIKPFHTSEYEIIGYTDGRGKDKGAVLFKMKTANGHEFVVAPKGMTYDERKELFTKFKEDKNIFNQEYKNKMATIQYASLSKDKVPQQGKFLVIRNYE